MAQRCRGLGRAAGLGRRAAGSRSAVSLRWRVVRHRLERRRQRLGDDIVLTKQLIQQEALGRAVGGQSLSNWPAIIAGFMAKGISESDIRPRENVFTYHAWRALGRQVRRGEHGVKVVTFVSVDRADDKANPDSVDTND